VANILAKEGQIVGDVDTSLLVEDAEKALFMHCKM
jgi:glycyl-tRNA synthetase beta chain